MKNPDPQELIVRLKLIKKQCDEIIDMVQFVVPDKEWYTTKEAAKIVGIKPKTASSYCSMGIWKKVKKDKRGRYLIHASFLEEY
ncbi:helix-turn-helix domain-containing protein [Gracilimonas tropica]|uniref:helix-turn-helix domain-containing protein n=1 Tax=Gracilimonas tropica TaxID=454600 RepID=UPI00036F28C4|nr:helix-turn-helix domain-containing protein [Gracilimonas tropica]